MNILCYGVSSQRQKDRCDFFEGVGCRALAATDLDEAVELLSKSHFDAVVFGHSISSVECKMLAEVMCAIQPWLCIFPLSQLQPHVSATTPKESDMADGDDEFASLVTVYTQLQLRSESRGIPTEK